MIRLHHAASTRWRNGCPCCGVGMRTGRVKTGRPTPANQRTVGHVDAVALGGDPDVWLYMCNRCNNNQGSLSFAAFARMLVLRGDPRAERVVEVARFVQPWRPAHKQEQEAA